jgi:Domain of unknown function (DUF4252)
MRLMIGAVTRSVVLISLSVLCGIIANAQEARLKIDHLDKLSEKASETVEVTLDERLLQLAAKFLNSNNPEEARVKELVAGLKGVYVRVFEFDKPGEYATSDVDTVRSQLLSPGWSKIVGVRSKRDGNNVDVHIKYQGNNILGLAIIAAEPKELTVVNIVGPIDLEKLSQLEGQFGIPKFDLERIGRPKTRN